MTMHALYSAFLVALVSMAFGSSKGLAKCSGDQEKYGYPVLMKGPSQIAGFSVNNFKAYAKNGKTWSRIPMQIDEVNARGDYVLEEGLPFTKDTDDGYFDDNDELVLWGGDLGGRFTKSEIPKALVEGVVNFWKIDACSKGKYFGTFLLIATKFTPAPIGRSQTKFDAQRGVVESSEYKYVFNKSDPVLLGEVFLKGKDKTHRIIEKSEFLMPLKLPWFLPNLEFQHSDFESEVECWRTGPIRSIVAVGVKYKSFLSIIKLHLFSELVFYRNKFEIPTIIEFIFSPKGVLNPGSGVAYSLTFPKGGNWNLESNLEKLPKLDPEEIIARGDNAGQTKVFAVKGYRDVGSFMVNVRVDEKARKSVPPPYLLRAKDYRDKELQKHWGWLEEIPGNLGIYVDFSQVEKGEYEFGLDLVLSTLANDTFTNYGFVDLTWSPLVR